MPAVTRQAHAKLNLLLSVGAPLTEGPRTGYHPLVSWMACIDLHDDVRVTPLPVGSASTLRVAWAADAPTPGTDAWPAEKDLAMRARAALEAHIRKPLPAAIELVKRIPLGGGLGGGSSDAGACLVALREAFALDVSDDALREVGAGVGSDVAFFVADGVPAPAIVSGLGEVVERTERVDAEVLLVVPPFGVATAPVYAMFDSQREQETRRDVMEKLFSGGRVRQTSPREHLVRGRVEEMIGAGRIDNDYLMNDLAKPAFGVEPRLGALVTALSRATREQAHVTGSGACVFLVPAPGKLEKVREQAQRALDQLAADEVGPLHAQACVLLSTRLV